MWWAIFIVHQNSTVADKVCMIIFDFYVIYIIIFNALFSIYIIDQMYITI